MALDLVLATAVVFRLGRCQSGVRLEPGIFGPGSSGALRQFGGVVFKIIVDALKFAPKVGFLTDSDGGSMISGALAT